MKNYMALVEALAVELGRVAQILSSLTADDWKTPTLLVPVEKVPNWTVVELAGHLGYAMTMIDTLLSNESASPPVLDRFSYYDQPKGLLAPLAYRAASDTVTHMTAAEVFEFCLTSFCQGLAKVRGADPTFVGWTVIGTIRVDDFVATRIVEVVVHGLDLALALNRPSTPSVAAVDCAADVLDALNRRRGHTGNRPESLADNWLWVQVASGRRRHDDFPVPLLN